MTSGLSIVDAPSPNFDARELPVSMIVLHYTGMESAQAAIDRLRDPEARVSAHYLVDEDGSILRLVDERHRAWHAGRSHWRGVTDVNSASIGIELVNPGLEFGYRPFPEAQMGGQSPRGGGTTGSDRLIRSERAGACGVSALREGECGC